MTAATECAPEVTKARKKASERQKSAKLLKMTFLKKLNHTMINSLKLYADNMLCMDLCCWSVPEAVLLIGQQVGVVCWYIIWVSLYIAELRILMSV